MQSRQDKHFSIFARRAFHLANEVHARNQKRIIFDIVRRSFRHWKREKIVGMVENGDANERIAKRYFKFKVISRGRANNNEMWASCWLRLLILWGMEYLNLRFRKMQANLTFYPVHAEIEHLIVPITSTNEKDSKARAIDFFGRSSKSIVFLAFAVSFSLPFRNSSYPLAGPGY